jgi:hypothetical protein
VRFNIITKGLYQREDIIGKLSKILDSSTERSTMVPASLSRQVTIVHQTITRSNEVVQMTQDLTVEVQEEKLDVAAAKKILLEVHQCHQQLASIYQQLLQINATTWDITTFASLATTDKETIINGNGSKELPGLDFGSLNAVVERQVIVNLYKCNFRILRIRNSSQLTSGNLIKILRASKALLALEISGCRQIDDTDINSITKYCNELEKLTLVNLPEVINLNLELPHLRHLAVNSCDNLKTIETSTTRLTHFFCN